MMKRFFYSLRGLVNGTALFAALILVSVLIIFFGVFTFILPTLKLRMLYRRYVLAALPRGWMTFNKGLMWLSTGKKWHIEGSANLKRNGTYLLISNHQSWLDILSLGFVFNRKIPPLKFFMKKELLWTLPLGGVACWLLGYPFMERPTREQIRKNPKLKGRDLETTVQACQLLKLMPNTVINFVEGTRFSTEKKERQNSPYRYLLKPKAAGIAIVLKELQEQLDGFIDVTMQYKPMGITLWQFVCGDFEELHCHYRVLPVRQELIGDFFKDREFRKRFQAELNAIWESKDHAITQHQKTP